MISAILVLLLILVYALLILWAERKIAAFVQDRMGPMEVGYKGLGQSLADILKLLQKEDIVPATADKFMFKLAPLLVFTSVFAGFACIPFIPSSEGNHIGLTLFFILSIISLDVIGVIMAGWGSGSKYPVMGAMRAIAQIVSYEIPLTLSVLCVVITCQSLDLQEISYQQGLQANVGEEGMVKNYFLGLKFLGIETGNVGGIFTWNVMRSPFLFFAFMIFFITALAECNRAPFDIPEADSELVSGFHTEYSGFRFAILFLGEYALMLLLCLLGVILFLGSWNSPLPNIGSVKLCSWTTGEPGTWASSCWAVLWLSSKTLLLLFIQIMARWTYPRLRVDQLMNLCWKVLIPSGLLLIFVCSVWRILMI
ncbi:MAG: NADH-quinone oxidoreductase subunit H [Cytophagaceae bacterium]|nr:NADH-quinone oxidoreductase subunit H [Cytophagaceae bacterium]MDW8457161.1 complex I subunit 1 family protein [Cytophagaceae bacterium]